MAECYWCGKKFDNKGGYKTAFCSRRCYMQADPATKAKGERAHRSVVWLPVAICVFFGIWGLVSSNKNKGVEQPVEDTHMIGQVENEQKKTGEIREKEPPKKEDLEKDLVRTELRRPIALGSDVQAIMRQFSNLKETTSTEESSVGVKTFRQNSVVTGIGYREFSFYNNELYRVSIFLPNMKNYNPILDCNEIGSLYVSGYSGGCRVENSGCGTVVLVDNKSIHIGMERCENRGNTIVYTHPVRINQIKQMQDAMHDALMNAMMDD